MQPVLVIVGAQKGGVGKTTVSRILLDYFKGQGMDARTFDNEPPKGVLKRFYPGAEIVDLVGKSDDQMKIFDKMLGQAVTLVDLSAGMLTDTIKVLSTVGLLKMVEDGLVRVVVFHVVGNSVASLDEIKATAPLLGTAKHVVVKNHANDGDYALDGSAATVIEIPKLDPTATIHVDQSNLPYLDFIAAPDKSFTMKGHVRTWLAECFAAIEPLRIGR